MENTLAIITEIVILIFNLLIFMQLTILKKDTVLSKGIMYAGTGLMLISFFICTYFYKTPEAISSFLCITIPSSLLFFTLSKYKDFRFFTTFCFLDTLTLVITFLSRATEILFGKIPGIIAYILVCAFMCIIYLKGKPYFKQYRTLMETVNDSWGAMALSTFLIYVLLIFSSTYPEPLIDRPEYILPYTLLSITLLSFYAVFLLSLLQKKKLYDLNIKLQKEQRWHRIAYEDALTGMANRMAYVEKINELERSDNHHSIHAIMMDLDNFKKINDTLGHHIGDLTLKKAAEYLNIIFSEDCFQLFRIGGDEFAVVALNASEQLIQDKLYIMENDDQLHEVGCTFSIGCSAALPEQNNSIENAFIRADSAMYEKKAMKKAYKTQL